MLLSLLHKFRTKTYALLYRDSPIMPWQCVRPVDAPCNAPCRSKGRFVRHCVRFGPSEAVCL